MKENNYDTIIIGAGLSGLITGINLQLFGKKTLIIEKRLQVGGLCGTFFLNDYEFVIACNDFGNSIKSHFKNLGIDQKFKASESLFSFSFGNYNLASIKDLLKLLKFTPDILRVYTASKKIQKGKIKYTYLYNLIENHTKNENFKDIAYSLSYAQGLSPKSNRIKDITDSLFRKDLNYGYDKMQVPIGGVGVMIENIYKRYLELGGKVLLNTYVSQTSKLNKSHQVYTNNNKIFNSKTIASSIGRFEEYPKNFKEGIQIGSLHLAIKSNIQFPDNYHAIFHFPKNILSWMDALQNGSFPKSFGFHFFKSDILHPKTHYTVNVYHFVPQGISKVNDEQREVIRNYIIEKMETHIPNLSKSIIFEKYIDPVEFKELHNGLTSHVFKKILVDDFEKPSIYDKSKDIYFIGNSVNPPGEHASGAILSGLKASKLIMEKLNNS